MEKLAIDGGNPVRNSKISYGKQWIDEDDISSVIEVLKGDYLTTGPYVRMMEKDLETYTGAHYAVAVSNGTAALHCACLALGISEGDEVITTPLTFAASANCILYCGATPVFADINPKTYNIDPKSIEKLITEKTKAIIAVDFTGQVVEAKEIREICNKYNLYFIEDAAHSIGSEYGDKKVGSIADVTCFSFHPVKTITSGEGGAVLTNDKNIYKNLILYRGHGITHDPALIKDDNAYNPWYYEQLTLGYNYRMTDFQAALLISQLKKIDKFKNRRQHIAQMYKDAFVNLPGIILQQEIKETDTCPHLFIIRLDNEKLTCTRKEFYDAMFAENIQCQVHYIPVYWFPYYQNLGYKKGLCPNAEAIYNNILTIPLYPLMSDEDINDVIKAVTKIVLNYLKKL